jgi:hypothetical protein
MPLAGRLSNKREVLAHRYERPRYSLQLPSNYLDGEMAGLRSDRGLQSESVQQLIKSKDQ